jgi:H+/Cl- antiporter ClcA
MKKQKTLKELETELNWLETTPFYIGKDGLPNITVILLILLTGIIWGLLGYLIYRNYKKKNIRKKINKLKKIKGDKK